MPESMPEPKPDAAERPAKAALKVAASTLTEGPEPDPDQYGWGV